MEGEVGLGYRGAAHFFYSLKEQYSVWLTVVITAGGEGLSAAAGVALPISWVPFFH